MKPSNIIAAFTLSLAGAAFASAQPSVPSAAVAYRATELATDAGALDVYRRIAMAARKVCPGDDSLNPFQATAAVECQKAAIARAVAQIEQPRLAEIAAKRAKRG